jgi:UDP-glucose-4-epimerase GalE
MHFAAHAYVGESVRNPRKYFSNNVRAGLCLLDMLLEARVRRVVFSSTCAVYGIPSRVPISEDFVCNPVSPYGTSKLFFERALHAYDFAYGVKYAALRYFNAAGADESGDIGECHQPETHLIPLALRAAAGLVPRLEIFGSDYPTPDGTCVRDYVHVEDLADAHVAALESLSEESLVLNLGAGRGYSNLEIVRKVEEITHRAVPMHTAPRRPGDPPVLVADPARAREVLQWQARRSLDDIIRTAWAWTRKLERSLHKKDCTASHF